MTADHTPERREALARANTAEAETRRLADDLCTSVHDREGGEPHCQECYDLASSVMDTPWFARLREQTARVEALREKWTGTRDGVLSPGLRLAVDDLDREWFQQTVERRGREAAALLHPQDVDHERTSA